MNAITVIAMLLALVAPYAAEWTFKRLPLTRYRPTTTKTQLEFAKTYGNWVVKAALLYTVYFFISAFLFWLAASLIADALSPRSPEVKFVLSPAWYVWLAAGVVPAFFIAGSLIDRYLLKHLGSQGLAEFREYASMRNGYDVYQATKLARRVFVPISLVCTVLAVDNRLVVTESEIVVNRYFGFGQDNHSIAEIEQLSLVKSTLAPVGDIVRRDSYSFRLRGEDAYNLEESLADPSLKKQQAIIEYLSEKTSRPIVVQDPYPPRQSK